ncbi:MULTISPECIES: hypothetical protein [Methylobacterium]|uniref:Uncharacterized protein n=1 Tax=Methylobacterium thuringiense TaxID=1003091 RepID=A0ABQ4TLD4_9HYPH|nr:MULTISPECIES: hypothetical protein [Methylobacterium]TXN21766.1 hypothetical protein FV217_13225 [Methylobacterium sp. WL9]GJE54825.1 hypothetical protein EKPJFOCH_1310 [Methylobacterium thuringiense]
MLTLSSILARSILMIAAVGGLTVLADGAVRSQLERAVRGNMMSTEPSPVPVHVVRRDDHYVIKGLDRARLNATVLMVGVEAAE